LASNAFFFATGASVELSPSLLWHEELYLMLLDASAPIAMLLPKASIEIHQVDSGNIHRCWWRLVEALSIFDRGSRYDCLPEIRAQLKLPTNWKDLDV